MKLKEIKTPEQMRDKGWHNAWLYDLGVEKEYNGIKYRHLIVSCNICRTSPECQIFTYPANGEGDRIALGDTPIMVWSLNNFTPIFNQQNLQYRFICKCGGTLRMEQGDFNKEIIQDPLGIGTKEIRKQKIIAICESCGFKDDDYFKS